jgi:hypothetical protein
MRFRKEIDRPITVGICGLLWIDRDSREERLAVPTVGIWSLRQSVVASPPARPGRCNAEHPASQQPESCAKAEARELLVQAAPEAVEVLTEPMRSSNSAIARVQAAKEILERSLGRSDREESDFAVDPDWVDASSGALYWDPGQAG